MTTQIPRETPKAGWSTPMLHARDLTRSIAFYQLLGFTLSDFEGEPEHPGWARMASTKDDSAIMFLLAEDGHYADPAAQGILLALYTPDLPALREHLLANNFPAPVITFPDYMPSGSLHLRDPDGYTVIVHHWSRKEDDDWQRRLTEKRAKGILPPALG